MVTKPLQEGLELVGVYFATTITISCLHNGGGGHLTVPHVPHEVVQVALSTSGINVLGRVYLRRHAVADQPQELFFFDDAALVFIDHLEDGQNFRFRVFGGYLMNEMTEFCEVDPATVVEVHSLENGPRVSLDLAKDPHNLVNHTRHLIPLTAIVDLKEQLL